MCVRASWYFADRRADLLQVWFSKKDYFPALLLGQSEKVIFLKIKSVSRLQIQNITWNLKCRRQKTIIKLYEVVKFAEN